VSLFAVLFAAVTLVSVVYWAATVSITAAEAKRANEVQDQKLDTQTGLIIDVRDRLIRIEEKVKH
jgi:membrane protein implicated in regulation of membrane protease activity